MAYTPIENLLGKTESIYKLVILAAKRSVELNQGAGRLVDGLSPETKISTVALREIADGKIVMKKKNGKGKEKK